MDDQEQQHSQPARPFRQWHTWRVRGLTIGGALLILWGMLFWYPAAERNRVAPIVIGGPIGWCACSPLGKYVYTGSSFYDLATGRHLSAPILPPEVDGTRFGFWLSDETFFFYTRWTEEHDGRLIYRLPADGWVVTIASGQVLDVRTMPLADQTRLLATAQERSRLHEQQLNTPRLSPNGYYRFVPHGSSADIRDAQERILSEILLPNQPCSFGWRPDSSGHYFAEETGIFVRRPGPLRVLLVHPPSPWVVWRWLVLGGALLALLAFAVYRRSSSESS